MHEGANMAAFRFMSLSNTKEIVLQGVFYSENLLRTRLGGGFYYNLTY